MSDTIRNVGFEGRVTQVLALKPQSIADDTPVLSSAISFASYARARAILLAQFTEVTPTAHTITFSVTESATSDGSYASATTSGSLAATTTDGTVFSVSIKRNPLKPFIKITATGSHADVDAIVSAQVLFIFDGV